jgi:hypothetical protein
MQVASATGLWPDFHPAGPDRFDSAPAAALCGRSVKSRLQFRESFIHRAQNLLEYCALQQKFFHL